MATETEAEAEAEASLAEAVRGEVGLATPSADGRGDAGRSCNGAMAAAAAFALPVEVD